MIANSSKEIVEAFKAFRKETPRESSLPTPTTSPTPVRAKLDYSKIGVCIYCKEPMKLSKAVGQTVYFCAKDRYVSPLQDDTFSQGVRE
jgi:hypothetical protein